MAVAAVLILAVVGVFALRSDEGGGEGDGKQGIDQMDLFLETSHRTLYLSEGQSETFDVIDEVVTQDPDVSVLLVYRVQVVVTWTDEPDERQVIATWENQPDTFTARLTDTDALVSGSATASNTHGRAGMVEVTWLAQDRMAGYGDRSLVKLTPEEVVWDDAVTLTLEMVEAGDQTHFIRPSKTDGGNECLVELTVEGYFLSL